MIRQKGRGEILSYQNGQTEMTRKNIKGSEWSDRKEGGNIKGSE